MELSSEKRKPIMRIIISGTVILAVCMGAWMLYVSDLRSTFRERVKVTYEKQLLVAGQTFEDELKGNMGTVEVAAHALSQKGYMPTEKQICQLLEEFCRLDDFYLFTYVSEKGTIYASDGSSRNIGNMEELATLNAFGREPHIEMFWSSSGEEGEPRIIFVAPVIVHDLVVGHMVALKNPADIFDAGAYDYLREIGTCYMINQKGKVFAANDNGRLLIHKNNDFFMELVAYSDQKSNSVTSINRFKVDVIKKEMGQRTFTSADGEEVLVAFYKISGIENTYFVSCYAEGAIGNVANPIAFRTILLCVVIIVSVITLVVVIWISSKKASDTIEKMAFEDTITKGKNLNYFYKKAAEIMSVNSETPYLIQRFDIAHFRYLNESYGHNRADEVLKACVSLADKFFYEKEVCVRMNSDQFLMLTENDGRVEQRREAYIQAVNEYARSIGIKYPIRFKFGIYQVRKHDKDMDIMIDRANVARKSLNGDKKESKAYYSDELTQEMRKIDLIESEMQKAMEEGEFKVFLQPKWDILKNKMVGAEALVRWIRNGNIVAGPDEFIPIFEKNGFIEKLDFYMLETMCRRMRKLLDADEKIYPVSINQSRILLYNPEYVNNIAKILKRYRIPEGFVELELTETVFFEDKEKMIEIMNHLKEYKIPLLMDDFGSGYSSLNFLKDIPFDIVKIDREFFSESITSKSSTWILQKVTEMAEGLDIAVVCEGVETEEQVEKLKEIGVRYVQGFYYGKPLDMEEFIEHYRDWVE